MTWKFNERGSKVSELHDENSFYRIDMKKIERRHHDELITFFLVDTEEGYHSLAYNNAKAFILCYGIDSLDTFKSIPSKWIPELENIPEWPVPFILVGKNYLKKRI